MSKRKVFELGADVERALLEIISINDDLPEDFRRKMEAEKDECSGRAGGM